MSNTIDLKKYKQVLAEKQKVVQESGFDISYSMLNPKMFEFQKFIVKRALRSGKYAIFGDCGLGKTFMQLEWARHVVNHTNKSVLVVAPLTVVDQTIDQGLQFGISVYDYMAADSFDMPQIFITNYEQLQNIDASLFSGVVMDESSILKNFEGKTKKLMVDMFAHTPYKLACTATPSPNDPMELGNHAEMLDVMPYQQMLAMFFVHDGGETSKWRLKGHAVKSFYQFVGTWAIMLSKPCDIGFDMEGYDLPPLNIVECMVETEKKDNGLLFNDDAVSATTFNQELRNTMQKRMEVAAEIVNSNPDEPFIVWINHDAEGDLLRSLIPDSVEVRGSDDVRKKKANLLAFGKGAFRVLITKTKIASMGLNYQHCNNQIFASLDFSFEKLYQGIRRSYRFGQQKTVNIYLITTDTMANVKQSIEDKQRAFQLMQSEMAEAVSAHIKGTLKELQPFDITEESNEWYTIKRGDCVQCISTVPDASVGFSVFSPPFPEIYTYSSYVEDMGNAPNFDKFFDQFGFLVAELRRVMMEGRNVAVHCMDLPIQKGKEGFIGLRDFSGALLRAFCGISNSERIMIDEIRGIIADLEKDGDTESAAYRKMKDWMHEKEDFMRLNGGFVYHSRITIWKDPVVEMQRTKALGLLHKQVKKDSTMSRVGIPDYVLVFRKDGDRDNPVQNTDMSVDMWQKIASPVWMDIDYGNTMQGFRNGRDGNDEKHICPLQLDTIERLITLYTNEGDTVLTPFMGIGSEVYQAVKMNRKAIGFELKESYYDLAKKNVAAAVLAKSQKTLF